MTFVGKQFVDKNMYCIVYVYILCLIINDLSKAHLSKPQN